MKPKSSGPFRRQVELFASQRPTAKPMTYDDQMQYWRRGELPTETKAHLNRPHPSYTYYIPRTRPGVNREAGGQDHFSAHQTKKHSSDYSVSNTSDPLSISYVPIAGSSKPKGPMSRADYHKQMMESDRSALMARKGKNE